MYIEIEKNMYYTIFNKYDELTKSTVNYRGDNDSSTSYKE